MQSASNILQHQTDIASDVADVPVAAPRPKFRYSVGPTPRPLQPVPTWQGPCPPLQAQAPAANVAAPSLTLALKPAERPATQSGASAQALHVNSAFPPSRTTTAPTRSAPPSRPNTPFNDTAPAITSNCGWKGQEKEAMGLAGDAGSVKGGAASTEGAVAGPPNLATKASASASIAGIGASSYVGGGDTAGGPSKSLLNRLSGPSDGKAGLSRDPEEVKRIIYEASKNSPFFRNEQKKDEELQKKVAKLVEKADKLVRDRGGKLQYEERKVDEMIRNLEKTRDLSEVIAVVDADAFYASCHELEEPALKGTAFVVGNGVCTTASYEARKYGCRSAMAGFIARKLCPHLRTVPLRFELYTKVSKQIMEILRQYGDIAPASLDEAYCSLTEYCAEHKVTPAEAVQRMRDQVKRETGCTVSAGVSPNKTLSKIAADKHKPDGQCVIDPTPEACKAFMHDLPVRKIPGIGRVSEQWLLALGVTTVADIYKLRGKLYLVREQIGLTSLLRSYLGLGGTVVESRTRDQRRGIGDESTFRDVSDPVEMYGKLRKIAESLAKDMEKGSWAGRTLTLKLKLDTFQLVSRAITLGSNIYFSDADTLYNEGKKLLDKEIQARKLKPDLDGKGRPRKFTIRLLGLRMSNLRDEQTKQPCSKSPTKSNSKSKPRLTKTEASSGKKPAELHEEDADQWDIRGIDGGEEKGLREVDLASPDRSPTGAQTKAAASSDGLWEAVGDLEWDDDDLVIVDADAGPPRSLPKKVANTAENDDAEPATSKCALATGHAPLMCPVCNKAFVGSEMALTMHVEEHFNPSSKKSTGPRKRSLDSSLTSTGKSKKTPKAVASSLFGKK